MRASRQGATLIEVVMAMAIPVPVAVLVVCLFPMSHLWNQRAYEQMAAGELARTQMERVRATPPDILAGSATRVDERCGIVYTTTTTVTEVTTPEGARLKDIAVVVRWADRTLQFDTRIAAVVP